MKKILFVAIILMQSACANLQAPKVSNIPVSSLLDEIQVAVNEISDKTKGSTLPPFKSAEVKLSTIASEKKEGGASLVLSGGGSKTTSNSNTITLELVPNPKVDKSLLTGTGHEIAKHVIAAVTAVDDKKFLKLKTLNIEAGLEVKSSKEGGIEVELVGITVKGKSTGESSAAHSIKLTFAYPDKGKK